MTLVTIVVQQVFDKSSFWNKPTCIEKINKKNLNKSFFVIWKILTCVDSRVNLISTVNEAWVIFYELFNSIIKNRAPIKKEKIKNHSFKMSFQYQDTEAQHLCINRWFYRYFNEDAVWILHFSANIFSVKFYPMFMSQ